MSIFKSDNTNRYKRWGFFLLNLFVFASKSLICFSLPLIDSDKEPKPSYVYVFFDQNHSFVEKDNSLISTNYITIEKKFSSGININVFGSEHFCKNIFYFTNNKVIFYNPSQIMSSYAWCQVQFSDLKAQKNYSYRFIFNRTFSSWCQYKDSHLAAGKTVQAVLNLFDIKTCSDSIYPVLAKTRVLNLSNAKLEDISPIAGFLNVRSLWLDHNEIDNLEPLGAMKNLVFLSLNDNYISDARGVGEISALRWVFLNNNQIMHLDFIKHLKSLKFLGINGNLVDDPSPLYDVSSSTYVLAKDNPFLKTVCEKEASSLKKHSFIGKNCPEHTIFNNNNLHPSKPSVVFTASHI